MRTLHHRGGVRQMFCCVNLVIAALKNRAEIGQKIAGTVDADHFWARAAGNLNRLLRAMGECFDRFSFRLVGVKHFFQIGSFKDVHQKRRQFAKLEISLSSTEASEQADQGAQSAAIDVGNAAQMENKFLRFQKALFYFLPKGLHLFPSDNPPFAADDNNVADVLAFASELHWRAKLAQNRVKDLQNVTLRAFGEERERRCCQDHNREATGREYDWRVERNWIGTR